jgi:hypothetical protein
VFSQDKWVEIYDRVQEGTHTTRDVKELLLSVVELVAKIYGMEHGIPAHEYTLEQLDEIIAPIMKKKSYESGSFDPISGQKYPPHQSVDWRMN